MRYLLSLFLLLVIATPAYAMGPKPHKHHKHHMRHHRHMTTMHHPAGWPLGH